MKRTLRLFTPSAASIGLRLAQLLLMVAVARASAPDDQASSIAAFAVVASFAVFADAGAANYVLTRSVLGRVQLGRALLVQAATACVGGAASVAFAMFVLPWADWSSGIGLVFALALSQAIDSTTRVARAARLREGDDLAYGLGDFALAVTKSLIAVLAVAVGGGCFLLLPVGSIAVFIYFARTAMGRAASASESVSLWEIVQFGVSSAVSGGYSQLPFLVVAVLAPVTDAAALAIALRVVQPLEVIPAVTSQQLLPRIKRRSLRAPKFWAASFALGGALAVAVVAAQPIIEVVFRISLIPPWILALVATTLPLKYGNYILSAFLLALGGVNFKTLLSLVLGGLAFVVCVIGVPYWGSPAAAGTMILCELLLTAGLSMLISRFRSPEYREEEL